jgi:hypothetical protein
MQTAFHPIPDALVHREATFRKLTLLSSIVLACLCIAPTVHGTDDETRDIFGIKQLFPTRTRGRVWVAHWNESPRTFTGVDPNDQWFDADHGDGRYTVDGQGRLTATGPTVRMYVHDPHREVEWSENLEITVYFTRISETKLVSWSGPQIFARTNHGTIGNENRNLCDDRGYGAKITVDGRWEFEKETAHHLTNGYVSAATVKPWPELPKNLKVGVKFILRNLSNDTRVRLELYRDLTGGRDGGRWEKMTEFVDAGDNWGKGAGSASPGVRPELPLIRSAVLPDSESKKPMMSVYLRHEYGTVDYEKFSIREIDRLP